MSPTPHCDPHIHHGHSADPPPPLFRSPLRSITYNGSMDSPVPLYPTDFPPSYETVMGLRGDSQVGVTASRVGVDGRVGGGGVTEPIAPIGGWGAARAAR